MVPHSLRHLEYDEIPRDDRGCQRTVTFFFCSPRDTTKSIALSRKSDLFIRRVHRGPSAHQSHQPANVDLADLTVHRLMCVLNYIRRRRVHNRETTTWRVKIHIL